MPGFLSFYQLPTFLSSCPSSIFKAGKGQLSLSSLCLVRVHYSDTDSSASFFPSLRTLVTTLGPYKGTDPQVGF